MSQEFEVGQQYVRDGEVVAWRVIEVQALYVALSGPGVCRSVLYVSKDDFLRFWKLWGMIVGTHCNTRIYDETGNCLVNLLSSSDGDLTGHGQELVDFLVTRKLVSGIPACKVEGKVYANGMGCLSAQVVEHFKERNGPGTIYLIPHDLEDQRYSYHVYEGRLVVKKNEDTVYDGPWEEVDFHDKDC